MLHSTSLLEIHEKAFANCLQLSKINVEKVTKLEKGAFYNCNSLVQLEFGALESIPEHCFYFCPALIQIIGFEIKKVDLKAFNDEIANVTIVSDCL